MKLTNSKFRSIVFMLFVLTSTLVLTTSCKKDDDESDDKTTTVVGTYTGTYADAEGTTSLNYKVDVIKVDSNTIKIKPEGADATVFEADVTLVNENGNVDCSASDAQAIAFTKSGETLMLTYAIGGNSSETFVGTKQ